MNFKNIFVGSKSRRKRNSHRTRRLELESLDQRRVLAVFTPTPNADDGASHSLRAAVVASQSNQADDTIQLGAGIYSLRLGDLLVNEKETALRITGAGADQTVIKIDGDARAFDVDFHAHLEISGATILRGHAEEGGQIRSAGTAVLSDMMLYGGSAIQGGAVFNGGDLTLNNVEFVGNEAGVAAGVWNHAGATLTATNSSWLQNLTSEKLGSLITSNAQVGVVYPGSTDTMGMFSRPPRGATALFNAGKANLQSVVIAGNISETGGAISNVGDTAELRIEESLIYENESRDREGNAPSVLVALRGKVEIVGTAVFNNTGRQERGGTFDVFDATIDLDHVGIFNNSSPSSGFDARFSNVRWNHVTYVRSGTRGAYLLGGPGAVFQITASAIDRIYVEKRDGQFSSGGGNWTGLADDKLFNHPTDRSLPSDKQGDVFWYGRSFDFLTPGIYQGRVAYPPTATGELIDALANGDDAGAYEYVPGMEPESPLPTVSRGDLLIQEDSAPLGIDSLVPDATTAIAAYGEITRNEHGRLTYQTGNNFEGHDLLIVRGPDGEMRSWALEITPVGDPPTIEDYAATILGRSEVLGLEKPTATEITDLNAVSGAYQGDSLFAPNGNPSPGPDLGSEITAHGFVIDGELILGRQWDEEDLGPVPYGLSGDLTRPSVNIEYVPPAGFSGIDTRTARIVNTAGLTADATATFNVLDPEDYPAIGRVSAVILDANLEPIETARVGELLYIVYRIEDIRENDHPLQTLQRDFYGIEGVFHVGGAPLQVGRTCISDCKPNPYGDGKKPIDPQPLGFTGIRTPPTQLDESLIRFDAHLGAFSRKSGPFLRVAVEATASGVITADIPFVAARGAGIDGTIPYDWLEIVTDSVQILPTNTNMVQREDVNQDQVVAPADALIIINALNRKSAESEVSAQAADSSASYMWDVNSDGQLTPNDVLLVINYLNSHPSSSTGSGEGESFSIADQPLAIESGQNKVAGSDSESQSNIATPSADTLASAVDTENYYTPRTDVSVDTLDHIWQRLGASDDEVDTLDLVGFNLEG